MVDLRRGMCLPLRLFHPSKDWRDCRGRRSGRRRRRGIALWMVQDGNAGVHVPNGRRHQVHVVDTRQDWDGGLMIQHALDCTVHVGHTVTMCQSWQGAGRECAHACEARGGHKGLLNLLARPPAQNMLFEGRVKPLFQFQRLGVVWEQEDPRHLLKGRRGWVRTWWTCGVCATNQLLTS